LRGPAAAHAAHREEFEAQTLNLVQHAEQRGLVGQGAREHGDSILRPGRKRRKGTEKGLSENATHTDFIEACIFVVVHSVKVETRTCERASPTLSDGR